MTVGTGRGGSRKLQALLALVALLTAGCDALAPPSASPRLTDALITPPPPGAARVVACLGINPLECALLARTVLVALPPDRGGPYSMRIRLGSCKDSAASCPESLAARFGTVLVEYGDEGVPLEYRVTGTPPHPNFEQIEHESADWTDPIQPGSPLVEDADPGPFVFEVGHCGLLHAVDFDGSFWVLVGDAPGDHQALGSMETGAIRLVTQDRAEYLGTDNTTFRLARFPGPRRFQPCR